MLWARGGVDNREKIIGEASYPYFACLLGTDGEDKRSRQLTLHREVGIVWGPHVWPIMEWILPSRGMVKEHLKWEKANYIHLSKIGRFSYP